MSRVFMYARVSTSEQTTENQVQEIRAAGFNIDDKRCITETISGAMQASLRPGFTKLLDRLESGDVLVVTKIDRLGRSAMDVVATVERLKTMGVRVHCLQLGGTDLTSPAGKLLMTVMSAMAEFERGILIERTHAGLARAKAQGKKPGRKPVVLTPQQRADARERLDGGQTLSGTARALGVTRQTLQRAGFSAPARE